MKYTFLSPLVNEKPSAQYSLSVLRLESHLSAVCAFHLNDPVFLRKPVTASLPLSPFLLPFFFFILLLFLFFLIFGLLDMLSIIEKVHFLGAALQDRQTEPSHSSRES